MVVFRLSLSSVTYGAVCSRHIIDDSTKMNDLRFKYDTLNYAVPEFYGDEVKACSYVDDVMYTTVIDFG